MTRRLVFFLVIVFALSSITGCRRLFRRHRGPSSSPTAATVVTPTVTAAPIDAGAPIDPAKAAALASHLTSCNEGAGNIADCNLAGIDYEKGHGTSVDYAAAAKYYGYACNALAGDAGITGSPEGCANLAGLFDDGKGFKEDKTTADGLYLRACNAGSTRGCNNLGLHFLYALGGRAQDNAQAVAYFKKACDKHDAYGCTNLGYMYWRGLGVKKDALKAFPLYQEGCTRGDGNGCLNLGLLYEKGEGVTKNDALATANYTTGCTLGSLGSCVNLGLLYEKGRTAAGVKDPATAATYYQRACDGGRPSGCYNLGRLYERGTGVGLDVTQAKVNYKKACDKGDGDACQALTRLP